MWDGDSHCCLSFLQLFVAGWVDTLLQHHDIFGKYFRQVVAGWSSIARHTTCALIHQSCNGERGGGGQRFLNHS